MKQWKKNFNNNSGRLDKAIFHWIFLVPSKSKKKKFPIFLVCNIFVFENSTTPSFWLNISKTKNRAASKTQYASLHSSTLALQIEYSLAAIEALTSFVKMRWKKKENRRRRCCSCSRASQRHKSFDGLVLSAQTLLRAQIRSLGRFSRNSRFQRIELPISTTNPPHPLRPLRSPHTHYMRARSRRNCTRVRGGTIV